MAKFGFNVKEVEPDAPVSYEPIPTGEYTMMAVEAQEKQNSSKTGSYIEVKFQVVGGDYDGRMVWNIFNVNHESEKAQQIGRQQLVAWATACGKPDADDTDKLLNKKCQVSVGIDPAKDGYPAKNRIKGFLFEKPAGGAGKPAAARPATSKPAASAPTAGGGKPANPWD